MATRIRKIQCEPHVCYRKGFRPLGVYKIPDGLSCVIRVVGWLYFSTLPATPRIYQHLSAYERNAEIVRRYRAGESVISLAREFGVSDRRIRYILNPDTKR